PGEDSVTRQEPELRVLITLTDEEEDAEDDRRDHPIAKGSAVAALDRVHGDLHGHARHEELDGVDRRQADAEDRVDLPGWLLTEDRLPVGDTSAEKEVRGEKRAEEERFARDEQDDRPHARRDSRRLGLDAGLVRRQPGGGARAAAAPDPPGFDRGAHR